MKGKRQRLTDKKRVNKSHKAGNIYQLLFELYLTSVMYIDKEDNMR